MQSILHENVGTDAMLARSGEQIQSELFSGQYGKSNCDVIRSDIRIAEEDIVESMQTPSNSFVWIIRA